MSLPETAQHTRLFRSQIVARRFDDQSLRILESVLACKDVKSIMQTRSSLKDFMRSESLAVIRELSQRTVEQKLSVVEFFVRAFALIGDIESCLALKYEGLLLRDIKSSADQWMRVSYEEWLNFAEHSLDNGFHAVARQACDKALSCLSNAGPADTKTGEPLKHDEAVDVVNRLKERALKFGASSSVQAHTAEYLRGRILDRSQNHMSTSRQSHHVASILFRSAIKKRNARKLHERKSVRQNINTVGANLLS
ncbi:unnamed protein product [Linum trigynum]|uniref:Uncharacterized protein n=1 Tax=Linum trigynum TaxID=586398 RepID=A0AAV2D8X4_9ROSI